MKAWFLPIGLVLALILGLSFPTPGSALFDWQFPVSLGMTFIYWNVAVTFFITGWQMRGSAFEGFAPYAKALAIAVLCNLALAPILVLTLGSLGVFPAVLMVGASLMACMPTTLTSGVVICTQAGGDEGLAILLTVLLSLLGVILLPFSVSLLLSVGAKVDVPVGALVEKMAFIVLLPFAVGVLVRKFCGRPRWSGISYIPLTGIILTVWAVASKKHVIFAGTSLGQVAACIAFGLLVHVLLLAATYTASKLARLSATHTRSVVIMGSQKSLTISVAIMVSLHEQISPEAMGLGVLLCVVWNFSQTVLDSVLAAYWHKCLPDPAMDVEAAPVVNPGA